MVELPQCDAVPPGYGGEGLPRLDHVEGLHLLHHQGLSHRQGPGGPHPVDQPQQLRLKPR